MMDITLVVVGNMNVAENDHMSMSAKIIMVLTIFTVMVKVGLLKE